MTLDLTAIEARVNAASKGPWNLRTNSHGGITLLRGEETASVSSRHPQSHLQIVPEEDGEFIAHSREDVPALIREVQALRARLSTLTGVVRTLLGTPGLRFHRATCQSNEFGPGVARLGAECTCDLGKNVAAVEALMRSGHFGGCTEVGCQPCRNKAESLLVGALPHLRKMMAEEIRAERMNRTMDAFDAADFIEKGR